jgi:hypothetical protein
MEADMKILILGHGQCGKDTAAEILESIAGISWISSSWAACEKAVFPWLAQMYGYETLTECHDDRINHRLEWKQLITDYNTPDKATLCREILERHDCYVGMRCPQELAVSRHLFDAILWIDAAGRTPNDESMAIEYDSRMILVPNVGPVMDMRNSLVELVGRWQSAGLLADDE